MMIEVQSARAAAPYPLEEVRNVVHRMRRLAILAVGATLVAVLLGCNPGATPGAGGGSAAPPSQGAPGSEAAPGGY